MISQPEIGSRIGRLIGSTSGSNRLAVAGLIEPDSLDAACHIKIKWIIFYNFCHMVPQSILSHDTLRYGFHSAHTTRHRVQPAGSTCRPKIRLRLYGLRSTPVHCHELDMTDYERQRAVDEIRRRLKTTPARPLFARLRWWTTQCRSMFSRRALRNLLFDG